MKITENADKLVILKRLLIMLAVILLIFGTICGTWYFGRYTTFNKFAQALEEYNLLGEDSTEKQTVRYAKEIGEYSITMKKPAFLGGGGFVSVVKTNGTEYNANGEAIDGSDGIYVVLYIYPAYFGKYNMTLHFSDDGEELFEIIKINGDMSIADEEDFDPEYIKEIKSLISQNKQEILTLFDIMEDTFDISLLTNRDF